MSERLSADPAAAALQRLAFVTSVAQPSGLPAPAEPEIVFAGRSNAGKSSAINALANRRRLAFVSRTPGRTQLINLFRTPGLGWLVDLPGYGYAQAPTAVKRDWGKLIELYLLTRPSLVGLVLVMDIRHPLTPLDEQLLTWFAPRRLPLLVLLSKCDKLSRSAVLTTCRQVTQTLAERGMDAQVLAFSALNRTGVNEAQAVLVQWWQKNAQAQAPGQSIPASEGGREEEGG